ncbi:MAG TPA: LamG-like jellyroll fold domain-containing protein, partial [Hanamia sp.]|nr:LamG-like jellyroll fold domain-containing protein [Hanamia sp.]
MTGNQITVEALIYQTAVNPVFGTGDIVSKHIDPSDDNYLLRPDNCSITTTNGFYETAGICKVENNKIYHVAMVYDGNYLRFYRNGFLMSEIVATGNLIQNNQDTRIGYYAYQWWNQQFFGYINEVRIWNIARTAAEIKAYMNTSLPNPTTQSGLLAYYTFDNLINKQGNPSWNGTLAGNAAVNQKLPTCNFVADSCNTKPLTSIIINDYIEVTDYKICDNELIVKDATKYSPGDTVLIIQMKGADIDLSNGANFGNINDYKNAGNYEMNIIKKKNGNALSLVNNLERQYDIPNGKVQLIRVPYYTTANITSTLTCLPWDGSKGGVVVLNARDAINLSADIDVSGRGFSGGRSPNPNSTTLYCNYNDFFYAVNTAGAAAKGESISVISPNVAWGKGSPANGGGGGNGHNSGGGGGSNGGFGGFGGYQLDACGGSATDNRGLGGKKLPYSNMANKIFLGGGGGSGQTDNAGGSDMNGANGGGIIIIKSPIINNAGYKIIAKGADVMNCNLSSMNLCHDGNGGGGAGGTVLIESNNATSATLIDISGGKGGDLTVYYLPNASHIGPGGGGGAGTFWTSNPTLPANIIINKTGGKNGVIIPDGNNPYGTTAGEDGINIFNLKIPVDNNLFQKSIDSVKINSNIHNCSQVDFDGLPFPQPSQITNWNWSFGDGTNGNSQNTTHTYSTSATHRVKLVVSDVNGCKDSITTPVITTDIKITKKADTSLCGTSPVKIFAAGGSIYSWTPTLGLDNPNIASPLATPLVSTKYYVTVSNAAGCVKKDSVSILVKSIPVILKSNDTTICKNVQIPLSASGGIFYSWSPATGLTNTGIPNPVATPSSNTTYIVKVTNIDGCSKTDSIKINIKPVPVITKSNDTTICNNTSVNMYAGGGNSYTWTPAVSLNNPASATPVASPVATTLYHVVITDAQACSYKDSIKVSVRPAAVFSV